MMKNSVPGPVAVLLRRAHAWLAILVLGFMGLGNAQAAGVAITLYLENLTSWSGGLTLQIEQGRCYAGEGAGVPGGIIRDLPPTGRTSISLARDQGSACDNRAGTVNIRPTFANKPQVIEFSNDGGINELYENNDFASELSKRGPNGSYMLTFRDLESRLSGPVDERLTKPRNYVAADSGQWAKISAPNATTKVDALRFAASLDEGYRGSYYFTCNAPTKGDLPTFHPQHVVRLPNKNGRAYFMIAQSRQLGGYIYLVETFDGVLDPVTDLVRPNAGDAALGKTIWWQNFGSTPIGSWNHPGKMSLQGGVLVVAAQNWSEGAPLNTCTHSDSNPYQVGTADDAVLFYDVRDSAHPKYWGMLTGQDLGLKAFNQDNGVLSAGSTLRRQISAVSLVRTPATDEWKLVVGVYKGAFHYVTWKTRFVAPDIGYWTRDLGNGSRPAAEPQIHTSDEHGGDFESYQAGGHAIVWPYSSIPRNLAFDLTSSDGGVFLNGQVQFTDDASGVVDSFEVANGGTSWVADSIYVTPKGVPIAYNVEQGAYPDGFRGTAEP